MTSVFPLTDPHILVISSDDHIEIVQSQGERHIFVGCKVENAYGRPSINMQYKKKNGSKISVTPTEPELVDDGGIFHGIQRGYMTVVDSGHLVCNVQDTMGSYVVAKNITVTGM